jgi:hypothetical protein
MLLKTNKESILSKTENVCSPLQTVQFGRNAPGDRFTADVARTADKV